MATLISIPILGLLVMLQTTVVSRIPLLFGTADIVLLTIVAWSIHERVRSALFWAIVAALFVSLVSAIPKFVPVIAYLTTTFIAIHLRRRVWQTPILTMLLTTLLGTLIMQGLSVFALDFQGTTLPLGDAIYQVALPSTLLNLLLALPVYALVTDLANNLYPVELES